MKRREFLTALAGATGAATAGQLACSPAATPPPSPVVLTLSDLPEKTHRTVMLGGKPVDVLRAGGQVVARSLVCPHTGCLVRWDEGDSRYHCACHDGLFDAAGRVIGGQATSPLRLVPVVVTDERVTIGAVASHGAGAAGAALRSTPPAAPPGSTPRLSLPRTAFPLTDFPDGGRTVVRIGTSPVEVRRAGNAFTARSLLCTHMGCPVTWREPDQRYVCPCHGGLYDAEGRVVEGPPPRGLDQVPAAVEGGLVVVGQALAPAGPGAER